MKPIAIIGVFICAALLGGCGKAADSAGSLIDDSGAGRPMDGMERAYKPEGSFETPYAAEGPENDESREFEEENRDDEARAAHIKSRVEAVAGVETANVVVNGNSAIIGVSLSGEPGDDAVIAIKKQVERTAYSADPYLTRAAVTSAPEQFERITNIKSKPDGNSADNELNHLVPSF